MNKIQRNALAYARLMQTEYYFCLSYKGRGFEVILRFEAKDFHHLEGIGQLKDLPVHMQKGEETFKMALSGTLIEEHLKRSDFFERAHIQKKIDYLYKMEEAIDKNDMTFKYSRQSKLIQIEARLLLSTPMDNTKIFLYLDSIEENPGIYFGRSFVVDTDERDYRIQGQTKLTILWKEKRNRQTNENTVLYHFKDFTPEQLNT